MFARTLSLAGLALSLSGLAAAQDFHPPLTCGPDGCFIQNFADMDAGPGVADPVCGPLSYDGHDGLDFRVTGDDYRRGADVLAPASGVVRGVRDGEADGAFLASGKTAIGNRECGNGVAIDHGGGWESQLCHLKPGTVRVKPGDRVTAGQAVGQAGLSGFTQFPHVHLTLRLNGKVVEPFTGRPMGEAACRRSGLPPGQHWSTDATAISSELLEGL